MRHRNGSDHTSHNHLRMQQQSQAIYSSSNHHPQLHQSNLTQYGSPNLSTNSSLREQPSMTMNITTSTPEAAFHTHNGHSIELSPRHHIHSPVHNQHNTIPPPPPLLSQLEPMNHMLQYPMTRQTITRPTASPPPPPPPPPPSASAPSVKKFHFVFN